MGFFYFDESIQQRGGFIVGAFIYSRRDLTSAVEAALTEAGLTPGTDEYKSSARMSENAAQVRARSHLRDLLLHVRTGVVVIPSNQRSRLGKEALTGLNKILIANSLGNADHQVFFDEGIKIDDASVCEFRDAGVGGARCTLHRGQDSRLIGGLQVADLAAHSMGIMLLEQQGLLRKMVNAGDNSGYPPDLEIEIGFELWASLRYSFFRAPQPNPGPVPEDPVGNLTFDVENYGLHIAASCDDPLRQAALDRFGECYLGCIH